MTGTAALPAGDALPAALSSTDRDVVAGYRQDWARDPIAGWPAAVVRATCTATCRRCCAGRAHTGYRWCRVAPARVCPAGPPRSTAAVVLCTERMREITIDPVSRVAITQPGLLNVEVKRAAAEHGLWYPPDPSSFEMCSIGGNAATNAGGLCCVKYGVTTDYVLGMQVVLADGTALRLGGARLKDVAGLSLTKLFVGSEGTLGVITELTLRLMPAPPPAATLVASFASMDAAVEGVLAITSRPAAVDAGTDGPHLDQCRRGLHGDGARPHRGSTADRSIGCTGCGQRARDRDHAARRARRAARWRSSAPTTPTRATRSPPRAGPRSRRWNGLGDLLLEDVGVALPALPTLVRGIGKIAESNDVTIALVAHAGDGNTHPLIVYDPPTQPPPRGLTPRSAR